MCVYVWYANERKNLLKNIFLQVKKKLKYREDILVQPKIQYFFNRQKQKVTQ